MRLLPLALGVCLCVVSASLASAAIEIDLRVMSGGSALSNGDSYGDTVTKTLTDGSATFSSVSRLPNSDYYIGYLIYVTYERANSAATGQGSSVGEGSKDDLVAGPFRGRFNIQIWNTEFDGFLELEPGKYSPIIVLTEQSDTAHSEGVWWETTLRNQRTGEALKTVYWRWRDTDKAPDASPIHRSLPAKAAADPRRSAETKSQQ